MHDAKIAPETSTKPRSRYLLTLLRRVVEGYETVEMMRRKRRRDAEDAEEQRRITLLEIVRVALMTMESNGEAEVYDPPPVAATPTEIPMSPEDGERTVSLREAEQLGFIRRRHGVFYLPPDYDIEHESDALVVRVHGFTTADAPRVTFSKTGLWIDGKSSLSATWVSLFSRRVPPPPETRRKQRVYLSTPAQDTFYRGPIKCPAFLDYGNGGPVAFSEGEYDVPYLRLSDDGDVVIVFPRKGVTPVTTASVAEAGPEKKSTDD